ncbi:hypothetical protein [Burkholderia pseudomultivorans]|uniref:hypothetical protein n=1 Tax=Burkholderia pseudomultivorans TaxID=1207504 RepID=UPI0012D856AF|nr:hypothetical protein [Burkholderia pseudomultivorans]
MFFLILRGPRGGEKNCAAFGTDLREFSRGTGWSGAACTAWRRHCRSRRRREAGMAAAARRQPAAGRAARVSGDRGGILTVGAHSVSSVAGGGMSTSPLGDRPHRSVAQRFGWFSLGDRMMLTDAIHRDASGRRSRISTSASADSRDRACAHLANAQAFE